MTVAGADKRLTEYQTSPVLKHFDVLITCSTAHAYKYTYMLQSRLGPSWRGGFNLNEFFCCCCLMVKRQMHLARSHLKDDSLRPKFDPARSQCLLPRPHLRLHSWQRPPALHSDARGVSAHAHSGFRCNTISHNGALVSEAPSCL